MSVSTVQQVQQPWRIAHPGLCFIALLLMGAMCATVAWLAVTYWPYRHRQVMPLLEDVLGYRIQIDRYHRVYFPYPGFVATGITLREREQVNGAPLGTIETLSITGRWSDLFLLRRRVSLVEITRFHLMLPAPGNKQAQSAAPHSRTDGFKGPATAVEKILIHNSTLDILRANGGHYLFAIRELQVIGVQRNHVLHYVVDMENPLPDGHISAQGTFGPLRTDDVGSTPLSGQFTYNQVKLSDIGELRGTLASSGYFGGNLRSIRAEAISDTPNFAVDDGQPTPLRGFVRCAINGTNGDVALEEVRVSSGSTTITAHGQVAGSPKLTNIEVAIERGRAEEVLRPFMHSAVPVIGPLTLRSNVFIAAPGRPFLQRMQLTGDFNIPADRLSDRDKEQSLTAFSDRIEEHKAVATHASSEFAHSSKVLASLGGPVRIAQGVVSTPQLQFTVPGARATLQGTFNFENRAVHLTGLLKMDAPISNATTGWKSIFLKPLQPFFHRKAAPGSQIEIAVTGGPGSYKIRQDIAHDK